MQWFYHWNGRPQSVRLSLLLMVSWWQTSQPFNPPRPKSTDGGSFLDPAEQQDQWYILPKKRTWVVDNPTSWTHSSPSRLRLFSAVAMRQNPQRAWYQDGNSAWYKQTMCNGLDPSLRHGASNYFQHTLESIASKISIEPSISMGFLDPLLRAYSRQRPSSEEFLFTSHHPLANETAVEHNVVFQSTRHPKSENPTSKSKSKSKQKKKQNHNPKPQKKGKKHKTDDKGRNEEENGTYKGRWDSNGPDSIRLLRDLHSGVLTMDTTGATIVSKYPSLNKKWGGRRLKKNWGSIVKYYQKWKEGKNTVWTEASLIKAGLVGKGEGEFQEVHTLKRPSNTDEVRDTVSEPSKKIPGSTESDASTTSYTPVESNILERRVGTIQKPRLERPIKDARYDWYEDANHRSSPEMERYLSKQQQSPVEPNGAVYESLDAPPPDEKDDDHGEAMLELAYFEARGGRISRAEETFRSYVNQYPSASSYLRFAKFAEMDAKNVGLARSIYASMVSKLEVSQIRKPKVIEQWAAFEERYGQFQRAAEIRQLLYYGDVDQIPTIAPIPHEDKLSTPDHNDSSFQYKVSRVAMPKENRGQIHSSGTDVHSQQEKPFSDEEQKKNDKAVEIGKTLREEFFQGSSSLSSHQSEDWWDLSSQKANMSREMYNNQQGMKEVSQTLREEFFRSGGLRQTGQWGPQGNDSAASPDSFESSNHGGDWQNPPSMNDSRSPSGGLEERLPSTPSTQDIDKDLVNTFQSDDAFAGNDIEEIEPALDSISETSESLNLSESDEGSIFEFESETETEEVSDTHQFHVGDESFGRLEPWDGTGLQMDHDEVPSNDPSYGKVERWNGGGSLGLEVDKDTFFQAIGGDHHTTSHEGPMEGNNEGSEQSQPGWNAATDKKFRGGGFLKQKCNVKPKGEPLWSKRLDHSDGDAEDLIFPDEFHEDTTKKSVLSFLDDEDFGLTDSSVQQGLNEKKFEIEDSKPEEESDDSNLTEVPFFLLGEEDLGSSIQDEEQAQIGSSEQGNPANRLYGFVSNFFSKLTAPSLLLKDREVPYADEEAILNALAAIESADSDDAEAVANAADAILKALENDLTD